MNDDPVLMELEVTRRELWKESDGTLAGYARMVDRLGREERERFLAEQAGKPAGRRVPSRRRKGGEVADATMVREGPATGYGETQDSGRKGGEGEG
ncbi:MAG: hypothetical protein IJS32_09540 [Kiritimatiellae bacterium]|nr:hypothetical protein [Kiritimatiellia bacterium]